jgi:mannose-1-phosphate guanylyltransferase
MNWLVLLAGGRGERFWPLSRRSRPKQFLPLLSDRSLLQETRERVADLFPADHILVVTGDAYRDVVREQLPDVPAGHILAEPAGRGTAASVAWAAQVVEQEDPDAVLAVLPSDHAVEHADRFRDRLRRALQHATDEREMTLFGIVPDRPDTGFGYIETARAPGYGPARVARFVEKPSADEAERMVESGRFLWNSGMFLLPLPPLAAAFRRFMPECWEACRTLAQEGSSAPFLALDSVSIDVGIMERVGDKLAVFALQAGWDDVGNFEAVARLHQGRPQPGVILEDSRDVVVLGDEGPMVAAIGLQRLVIVRTPDAILILPPERAQSVRTIVKRLEQQGSDALL